jgi:hypothetical protein
VSMELFAIEDRDQIARAVRVWSEKFARGAEAFRSDGLDAYWHPELGVWGAFRSPARVETIGSYWNLFGRIPKSNKVVEINPPQVGINTNVQGVIAKDASGKRWILHQGRLHPPGTRITEDMFDAATTRKRVRVNFSDGRQVPYHVTANIDSDARTLQAKIASFVSDCENVRQRYRGNVSSTNDISGVSFIENLFPEIPGSYDVGPQKAKTIVKKHPDIWHKLMQKLLVQGVQCSNGRVERWGPDLRTLSKQPILFEIKSDDSAPELQRAVGQLLLYEKLLNGPHLKVLVYPQSEKSTDKLRSVLQALNITVLAFTGSGRSLRFEEPKLAQLIRYAKGQRVNVWGGVSEA